MKKTKITPAQGKLGVLIPGFCGAISTTLIGGVWACRIAPAICSVSCQRL